jgi:hypothetical protein
MDQFALTVLAQLSAQRELLVTLLAHRFLDEPDPIGATEIARKMVAQSPTAPPKESNLDPATSDLLAAMTDESMADILDRVMDRLEALSRANV